MASTVSTGKQWSRSQSAAYGAISAAANSRTTLRNWTCSGLRSNSTIRPYPRPLPSRVRAPARIRPASILRHLPTAHGGAIVRDGERTIVGADPAVVRAASGEAAFDVLREIDAGGFWAGFCSYDLGRTIERVRPRAADDLELPDVAFARYDARVVVHDDGEVELVGDRAAARRSAPPSAPRSTRPRARDAPEPGGRRGAAERWTSSLDRVDHAVACAGVAELLLAGECYQVNVTRRLTVAARAGSGLALRRADAPQPRAARERVHVPTRPASRSCRHRRSCSCGSSRDRTGAAGSRRVRSRARPPTPRSSRRARRIGPRT